MRSAETFPGGTGTSPMSDKAVTVLPEPDSPTSPTICPRPTSKETSSSTRTWPRSPWNSVRRLRTLSTLSAAIAGAQPFMEGSRASRSPSPTKLNASTAIRIATPGATATIGAWNR